MKILPLRIPKAVRALVHDAFFKVETGRYMRSRELTALILLITGCRDRKIPVRLTGTCTQVSSDFTFCITQSKGRFTVWE